MAIYLETLAFACVLFGFAIALRWNLEQIIKSIHGSLRHRQEKTKDVRNHTLNPHVIDNSEKSKYMPQVAQAGKTYHMTMGLKRLDLANWLIIDSEYIKEHAIRKELLDNSLSTVVRCLSGSELACTEALQLVIDFLVSRYPKTFILEGSGIALSIRNKATKEIFSLVNVVNPLQLAARLAMEDFNILMKDPGDQQYHLNASATLFPVGWKLQERIGGTMAVLHKPVPQWQEKLGFPIDRYFDRLSSTSTMERSNSFIQTTPALHMSTTPFPTSNGGPLPDHTPPSTIILRNERQTFRRLPHSQAILFTVHTYMHPLTSLTDDELTDFVEQMKGWSEEMATYKGRHVWGQVVKEYWLVRCGAKRECSP